VARNNEHEDPHGAHDPEARYANYFKAGYNAFEFLLDFGQYYAEDEGARLHTRIITSPIYAKTLLEFLRDCIERYELDFGPIVAKSEDDNQNPN
jgi:hypothetical protein